MSEPGEEPTYGLVMPFVVCVSKGGPYPDEAYVAGYEAGLIDADPARLDQGLWVHTENLPQIDLIAMRHARLLERAEPDDANAAYFHGWTWVITTAERKQT